MILQYKCPNCGTDMVFDSKTGTLHCDSCDHEEQIENYVEDFEEFTTQTSSATYDDEEARQYLCKNCGAVLVTDNHTAATVCSFCGSAMVLGDRISGDYAPTQIIPFKISKKEANAAFKKWCRKLYFAPKDFSDGNRIKEVIGMYVPFWLFDIRGQGEAYFHGTRIHAYQTETEDITETSHYDLFRQFDIEFDKIPADASKKMADDLMDLLEPFNYDELKSFKTPYLAGFLSEKYNFTDKELLERVKQRVTDYMTEYAESTTNSFSTVSLVDKNYNMGEIDAHYTLLPVWMVYYDYENAEYIFAMNGQTGKISGNPPLAKYKLAAAAGLIALSTFIIFRIITLLLGGPLL